METTLAMMRLRFAAQKRNGADWRAFNAILDLRRFLKKWKEDNMSQEKEIRISAKAFLHLRALCNALEVADESDATRAKIDVQGLGSISWESGKEVIIQLEGTDDKPQG